MALYRISPQPLQLIQPAHPAALLVNVGNEICYLDTVSTVSDRSYSLRLDPGQSVNFGGNTNLWAVCSLGLSTEISLLKDSNTTITPIRNVKIDGDVSLSGPVQIDGTVQVAGSVDIGGGTVNVGTISGDVSVDGSTVNIGNNVRLWGGGDYLGTVSVSTPASLGSNFNLATLFPALLTNKYYSVLVTVSSFTGETGVWSVQVYDSHAFVSNALGCIVNRTSAQSTTMYLDNYISLHCPIYTSVNDLTLAISNLRPAAINFEIQCWGSYTELSDAHIMRPYYLFNASGLRVVDGGIIPDFKKINYCNIPPSDSGYSLVITPLGGNQAAPISLQRLVPDSGGYVLRLIRQYAANLNMNTSLEMQVPPSPYCNCIALSASASNTLTSYTLIATQF